MESYTASISRGKPAPAHNLRKCYEVGHRPSNIDPARTHRNVVLIDEPIEHAYERLFGAALDEYNEKRIATGHPERCIDNYLEHVRAAVKLHERYEFVIAIGNMDEHPNEDECKTMLAEWLAEYQASALAEHLVPIQAVIHMDESTPHMHLEIVPVAQSKRGLGLQNSLRGAIHQTGVGDYFCALSAMDDILTAVMERHGLERVAGDRERQRGGIDINVYRKSMAAERESQQKIEEQERRLESLRRREEFERTAISRLDQAISRAKQQLDKLQSATARGRGRVKRVRTPGTLRAHAVARADAYNQSLTSTDGKPTHGTR